MSSLQLQSQIEKLPSNLQKEVEDFIQFLLEKEKKKTDELKSSYQSIRGFAKGKIKMTKDFDQPLEDFKEYM